MLRSVDTRRTSDLCFIVNHLYDPATLASDLLRNASIPEVVQAK